MSKNRLIIDRLAALLGVNYARTQEFGDLLEQLFADASRETFGDGNSARQPPQRPPPDGNANSYGTRPVIQTPAPTFVPGAVNLAGAVTEILDRCVKLRAVLPATPNEKDADGDPIVLQPDEFDIWTFVREVGNAGSLTLLQRLERLKAWLKVWHQLDDDEIMGMPEVNYDRAVVVPTRRAFDIADVEAIVAQHLLDELTTLVGFIDFVADHNEAEIDPQGTSTRRASPPWTTNEAPQPQPPVADPPSKAGQRERER